MVYNELCHKEIDWSKEMKQLLITLVAVVLGITAMSSYAEDDYKQRQVAKRVPAFNEEGKEPRTRRIWLDEEHNSDVSEEGKKLPLGPVVR